jgi:hypothetical protein
MFFSLPAQGVERFYSNGVYSFIQPALTPLSNRVPFSIADALMIVAVIGVPVWWIVKIRRAGRGKRLRAAGLLAFNTISLAAVLYLVFQLLWGLNYERTPLAAKLDFDAQRVNKAAYESLDHTVIDQLNAEAAVRRSDWPQEQDWRPQLQSSFDGTVQQLGNRRGIAPGRPKRTLTDFYLGAAGIEGYVNPYGLEVVLDSTILPVEKPFLLAHEWGHLAGFADESEASFVGLLACLHSDSSAIRYSGLLALYMQMHGDEAVEGLASEAADDIKAISAREARRRSAFVSRVQWAMYDRFLKASGVQAGVASYGMVIRLILGTHFEEGWQPARRAG